MRLPLAGIVALLATLSPLAAAGPCLVPGFAPMILTPANETLDQLGGVVVASVSDRRTGAPRGNVAVQAWEFREGAGAIVTRAKAVVTELAPGLAVYAVPDALQGFGRTLELDDTQVHSAVRVTFSLQQLDDMPMDSAPEPTAIVQPTSRPLFRTASVVATLRTPPPAGTVALVVRDPRSKAKRARSWVLVTDPKATTLEIFFRDRCEPEVPGTIATRAGDTVSLAWVDAAGHVSLWSRPMKVAAAKR